MTDIKENIEQINNSSEVPVQDPISEQKNGSFKWIIVGGLLLVLIFAIPVGFIILNKEKLNTGKRMTIPTIGVVVTLTPTPTPAKSDLSVDNVDLGSVDDQLKDIETDLGRL